MFRVIGHLGNYEKIRLSSGTTPCVVISASYPLSYSYHPPRLYAPPFPSLPGLKTNERQLMYFSRKNILTKGKRPLNAVSRVINASCGSASTTFARCWVHSTNKTSALFKTVKNQGFRRAYSTKSGADGPGAGSGGLQGAGLGLPFYRTTFTTFPPVRDPDVGL